MLLAPLRWALRIAILVVTVIVLYFAVTLVQVWLTSRQYDPHPAGAILVMGAAQDDCIPTLDLQARLDQAAILYHQGYAHLIMLTGSKQPGDKCTEAQSGAMYLEQEKGVPKTAILEAGGNDSYGGAGPQRDVPPLGAALAVRRPLTLLDRSLALRCVVVTVIVHFAGPQVADLAPVRPAPGGRHLGGGGPGRRIPTLDLRPARPGGVPPPGLRHSSADRQQQRDKCTRRSGAMYLEQEKGSRRRRRRAEEERTSPTRRRR